MQYQDLTNHTPQKQGLRHLDFSDTSLYFKTYKPHSTKTRIKTKILLINSLKKVFLQTTLHKNKD